MHIYVPLAQINDNPYQRRLEYGDLADLAGRILAKRHDYPDTYGLLQIPVCRLLADGQVVGRDLALRIIDANRGWPAGQSFTVQLAFGHRRLRAFRLLAEQHPADYPGTMPVNVLYLTDDQMLDACWSENRERRDLSAVEEAELLAEKLERARAEGGNQETVAQAWGLSRPTIANRLRLLDLPAEIQQANRDGRLSERQALALLPVIELEQKLNGAPAAWGDTGGPSWHPRSPAGFIAAVVADPDEVTSDKIRQYTQSALHHAGRPLGDAFATFDAGDGPNIVKSACKGCPRRQNQSCLDPRCYDARAARFRAVLPEWASRETGLPFSDKAADETDFTHTWDELEAIRQDWKQGRHDDLVVGIQNYFYNLRPYSDKGYVSEEEMMQDWRLALILGRRPASAGESQPAGSAPLRPSDAELKRWKTAVAKGDRERAKRTQIALRREIAPLAENEPAMRALMAMLDGRWMQLADDAHRTPTPDEFADHLLLEAWRHADTFNYGSPNRSVMRQLLHRAALSPGLADPPDPVLSLIDLGQEVLLAYEGARNHVGLAAIYRRLAKVRDALAEFDAAPHYVAGNADLEQLAAYLRAAVEREEKLLTEKLPEE